MMKSKMPKTYKASDAEDKWYQFWCDGNYFKGKVDKNKKPYSIVIPPPNVTGMLHLGHVLNNTLQDILIRWRKMNGYSVCWFPGTDHAGIATESKVEKALRDNGEAGRDELGREKFIEKVWEWKEEYGGTIIRQLRRLGASCDWDRERFTMDEGLSNAVRKVFVDLYRKGYIYRGKRMINWCPISKTALSDEEVIHKEVNGKFYHFQYPLSDGSGSLEIATTRPETMLGDSAVAVHPDDKRYKNLIGKTVKLPLTDREIPVIADEHADPEKGTGSVKITPAHDPNDFEVGLRHDLEFINVMNEDASMNSRAGSGFEGLDRFEAREKCVFMMEELGLLVKIEDIVHNVGYSERGDVPIETVISEQWFVNMKELAKPAIKAVKDGDIKFHPERWSKTYFHWMENIQDWCISRQIWWGHRIPAWYNDSTGEVYVGMEEPKEAGPWRQEEDVLDTWFSSWLWPFSIQGWPEENDIQDYFYPSSDLVTGPDIIFFWVARMIMAGYEFKGELPFKNVYFTSIIRDDKGRKLSKSLGNSPDPIDVIDEYGADALRFSIIYIAPIGLDIHYSNKKCELGRNFANKIWNAARFRQMQGESTGAHNNLLKIKSETLTSFDKWILGRLSQVSESVDKSLESFRFNEATRTLYDFVWNEFCDWYIEVSKDSYRDENLKDGALAVFDYALFSILKMLHPFMPFITDEIAHQLDYLNDDESIMNSEYPKPFNGETLNGLGVTDKLIDNVESICEAVSAARNLRAEYRIPPAQKIPYFFKPAEKSFGDFISQNISPIEKLAKAEKFSVDVNYQSTGAAPSVVTDAGTVFLPLEGVIDIEAELKKLSKQKKQIKGWIKGSNAKLSNEKFLSKAPENIVEDAKTHLAELIDKLERVEEMIKALKG